MKKVIKIEHNDCNVTPKDQLLTVEELKVIYNVLNEYGIHKDWICGKNIISKITKMCEDSKQAKQ